MSAVGGVIAATVAANAARIASQTLGIFSELDIEEFEKLVRESNVPVNVGILKIYSFASVTTYKLAIINNNGVNIVCFYPQEAELPYKYTNIGEVANPMNVILPLKVRDANQKLGKAIIIGLLIFLLLVYSVLIAGTGLLSMILR